ncbi:MAG: 4Fe-4S binding protein [Planctomycetaceae bacterium]
MPRASLPDIDERRCTLCGDCVLVCPTECLFVVRQVDLVVAPQDCISCGVCEVVCPVEAIAMRPQEW